MTAHHADPATTDSTASPGAAFRHVLSTALEFAAAKVSQKIDALGGQLTGVAASTVEDASSGLADVAEGVTGGGAKQQAAVSGVQAGLQGKNPVWAAVKGAWSGGGGKVKAAIVAAVVALVLLAVLSPVLLLVLLLGLLIAVAVAKVRSAKR